jgi:hypothetical protein
MAENDEQFLIAESCSSLALEIPHIFMSAYPGFIVFGQVNLNVFEKNKFF